MEITVWTIHGIIILAICLNSANLQCLYTVHDKRDYIGCFSGRLDKLIPNLLLLTPNMMSNDLCILGCRDSGYKFAGTEARYGCFCGNDIYKDPVKYPKVPDSECDSPCNGDRTQICGSLNRMTAYSTGLKNTFQQHNMQYMVKEKDVDLLAQPLDTVIIQNRGSRIEVVLECSLFCTRHNQCKVFTLSTGTSQCKLYTFLHLCDGLQSSPKTLLFTLL